VGSSEILTHGYVKGALWVQLEVVEFYVRLVRALDEHLGNMRENLHAHATFLQPEVDLIDDSLAETVDDHVLHGDATLEESRVVAVGTLAHLEGIKGRDVQFADAVLHAWRYLLKALFDALADVDIFLPTGRYITSCRMPNKLN